MFVIGVGEKDPENYYVSGIILEQNNVEEFVKFFREKIFDEIYPKHSQFKLKHTEI